ncbi:hypothetical protein L1887_35115 [Cichorium endivia]|nr:hypothetical protein L1887_35115 [Cichorium endivia]
MLVKDDGLHHDPEHELLRENDGISVDGEGHSVHVKSLNENDDTKNELEEGESLNNRLKSGGYNEWGCGQHGGYSNRWGFPCWTDDIHPFFGDIRLQNTVVDPPMLDLTSKRNVEDGGGVGTDKKKNVIEEEIVSEKPTDFEIFIVRISQIRGSILLGDCIFSSRCF